MINSYSVFSSLENLRGIVRQTKVRKSANSVITDSSRWFTERAVCQRFFNQQSRSFHFLLLHITSVYLRHCHTYFALVSFYFSINALMYSEMYFCFKLSLFFADADKFWLQHSETLCRSQSSYSSLALITYLLGVFTALISKLYGLSPITVMVNVWVS